VRALTLFGAVDTYEADLLAVLAVERVTVHDAADDAGRHVLL
jgi:hypothetical protein